MTDLVDSLLAKAGKLEAVEKTGISKAISAPIEQLREAANDIARAWSGSWLGYQSRVYYADFQPTPAGAHFSIEWGTRETFSEGTRGHWAEYTFEAVRDTIFSMAGVKSLAAVEKFADRATMVFTNCREEFLSIATIALENRTDPFFLDSKSRSKR